MIKAVKHKLTMFCLKEASKHAHRGGYRECMKAMDWLKRSLLFASEEEKKIMDCELTVAILKHTLKLSEN